ncbi:MAG: metal-dependent transcriptional regulator [Clostridiales bacterium]|jgi:Mn-dependent DtxR family transcriptional regulator|nr:metal-dependent transcriptional regulator [Clostridiales bacterium]
MRDKIFKIQESAENYLETILILSKRGLSVRSVDIAGEMGFTPPSVSVAMKNLRENEYILMDGDGFITLTAKGLETARAVYERHSFFSGWLQSLGVDEQTAIADACRIEHVISERSFEAIKRAAAERPKA